MKTEQELIKEFDIACWTFNHINCGTVNHIESKNKVLRIGEELKKRFGYKDSDLAKLSEV